MGLWFRLFQMFRARSRKRRFGTRQRRSEEGTQKSTVTSEWLSMTLNHSDGQLSGQVIKGSFSGQYLDDLEEVLLNQLIEECSGDEASLQLLESYVDNLSEHHWYHQTKV